MKAIFSLRANRPKTQGGMGNYIDNLVLWMGKIAKRRGDELFCLTTFFNHTLYGESPEGIKRCFLPNPGR